MYTIHTDVKMTRRKTMCHVLDDIGTPVWSGNSVFAAFDYMLEAEQFYFRLVRDDKAIRVVIGHVTD